MHEIVCECGHPVHVEHEVWELLWRPARTHTERLLNRILRNQIHIIHKLEREQMDITRLQADVEENTIVVDAVSNLVQILVDEIRANAGDETAVNALLDQFEADKGRLGDLVAANTPQTPVA